MATFLSPAVFINEIDLSALPASASGILPAFIGTANKGPLNTPVAITNAQQYVDNFGEPFPESFLGYAVLAYMEEGNLAWVMRVGVECEDGQPEELEDICIDTSGLKGKGWGRIPVFTNIDFGKIQTRAEGSIGFTFHGAIPTTGASPTVVFNDAIVDTGTAGPTNATLEFTGSDYTGPIDDSFILIITSPPQVTAGGAPMDGAGYVVIRNSDGATVSEGTLVESTTPGLSEDITLPDGIVIQVRMLSAGADQTLDTNDSFSFSVRPDNRTFSFRVDNEGITNVTEYTIPVSGGPSAQVNFPTVEEFVDAVNGLSGFSSERYFVVANDDGTAYFQTETEGHSIQLISTEGFALEIGQSLYAFDIPRSNLIGTQPSPFNINSDNNVLDFNLILKDETKSFQVNLPTGFNRPADAIAASIESAAVVLGEQLVRSYSLTIPGGDEVLVIEAWEDFNFGQVKLLANGSHPKSLRFADEVGIQFPYTENYRGFRDTRLELPQGGEVTEETPLSCEQYASGDSSAFAQCQADANYYQNIVGWFVAPSPGTWVDGYKLDLAIDDSASVPEGRYQLNLTDDQGVVLLRLQNFSFDPRDDRYIANILNPGSVIGGVDGNEYLNWIGRPEFLNNDPNDLTTFEVRQPASFFDREFEGQANGIPNDPIYSSELDRAVIGNPAEETGIYQFANPERYDISLLLTPGFSSGAVITTALSVCTQRGDCLYVVDPPFGLNAQQVTDWHNGLLFTDLQVALDSSYGALYHPWVKIFDQFNGGNIFIPPSGHVSSVFARTEREREIWFAPAGLNRGKLSTALDVEYQHTRGERDLLYGFNNAVNPIINYPQRGIHIFGQRTLQRRDSALDRVNVRMLLIAIKKALGGPQGILNDFLFEPNDQITRRLVTTTIEAFMDDVAARRGVTAYKVICDETNNTPTRIDRNELWVALLIKPVRAIEFIILNIGILRTDQSFTADEILQAVGVVTTSGQ